MRIPVSWLSDHLDLPDEITAEELAQACVRIGLEVESVTRLAEGLQGPLVVGRVVSIEELSGFKKPIRYCQVDVGVSASNSSETEGIEGVPSEDATVEFGQVPETQGIVCGATNFTEGALVVVALPGAVLPGDFRISERKTYGRLSQGMICSPAELGLGMDHDGILVLAPGSADPGQDAVEVVGLDDAVIELAITPDRGYCFSVRGLARELSHALDLPYGDPAVMSIPESELASRAVEIADSTACHRFVTRRVTHVDPTAPTPWWMRRRLALAGIRSVSLAVDVTNYVMLELGQPLHAWDTSKLQGTLVVRRAKAGEKLTTLDSVQRVLDPDDIVICDDSGPVSLAGVMGGATTEISGDTHDVLLEAAIWDPASISRAIRRHKLPSEAGRRFERGVDPAIPPAATEMAAQLLVRYGEGTLHAGRTDVGTPFTNGPITMRLDEPDRVAGVYYARGVTVKRLTQIGCRIEVGSSEQGVGMVTATPPSWRPDLTQAADLVEEVLRLEGYHTIPSIVPTAPASGGLTLAQRRERAVSRALAENGFLEVLPFPFTSAEVWDQMGLSEEDGRRRALPLVNPLESERSLLSTTLLTGLVDVARRNLSRGQRDLALFHIGQVTLPSEQPAPVPELGVNQRPNAEQLAALEAAVPEQPRHVGAILIGQREPAGWWGRGRAAEWSDAVAAAHAVADAARVELTVTAAEHAPWHPGRCAALWAGETLVGYAGELHPKALEALELPARTCAMELDLSALPLTDPRPAPVLSAYPPVLLDVALVVDSAVASSQLVEAVQAGGGPLLEDVRLFDVFTGEQVGEGRKSVALALRFRAPDRTLTQEEALAARDAAVTEASERVGASLRG